MNPACSNPHTVVVTSIRLDDPPVRVVLDEEERHRAERFVFERDRRRFIAAHSAMRVILGHHLGIAPEDGPIRHGARGKPHVSDPPRDVRFNLSHSGERALLAVTLGREVGVDIEETRTMSDMVSVAERVFSPAERERLSQTPEDVSTRCSSGCGRGRSRSSRRSAKGCTFPSPSSTSAREADRLAVAALLCRRSGHRWIGGRRVRSRASRATPLRLPSKGRQEFVVIRRAAPR